MAQGTRMVGILLGPPEMSKYCQMRNQAALREVRELGFLFYLFYFIFYFIISVVPDELILKILCLQQ
jgi:hypothetical protein